MTILTDDSSYEVSVLIDQWLGELRSSGFDEEALQAVADRLGKWAANNWQYCQEDVKATVLQNFVNWAHARDIEFAWLSRPRTNPQ